MSVSQFVIFCTIVLIAAIVQGVSGFTFGMMVLMIFPYIFGYTKALVLAGMMGLVLSAANAFIYRKYIDWKWIPRWLCVFIGMEFLSILVLKKVGDSPIWYTLMGIMFISMAIYLLWGQKVIHVKANFSSMAVLAALSGLIMGSFGVGGPLMAAFFLEATHSKEEYLGTVQGLGVIVASIDVILRSLNGMMGVELFGYAAVGLVFMAAGLLIAKSLVSHMNALTMRRIICGVMVLNGIVMLSH